ncbi:MAG: hypothetical protein LUC97_09180 [Clostridiales bacterium]|nr:hypothetical protein [Clostridiales bacterium]
MKRFTAFIPAFSVRWDAETKTVILSTSSEAEPEKEAETVSDEDIPAEDTEKVEAAADDVVKIYSAACLFLEYVMYHFKFSEGYENSGDITAAKSASVN